MAKVLMKRTVYDGIIYHHAGKEYDISGATLKKYLEKDWCDTVSSSKEVAESPIVSHLESKEEKEVYETKEKKFRTRKK